MKSYGTIGRVRSQIGSRAWVEATVMTIGPAVHMTRGHIYAVVLEGQVLYQGRMEGPGCFGVVKEIAEWVEWVEDD